MQGNSESALRRSSGPLSPAEAEALRNAGVALAYDPVQIGWVPADSVDDLHLDDCQRPWPRQPALTFRRWTEADAPRYAALLSDPRVWRYMPEAMPAEITPDTARDLIRVADTAPHHRVRAIVAGDEVVGQVRLLMTPPGAQPGEGEISYWLGASHWGLGIATAAVRLFSKESFATLPGLRGIFARVHAENAASAGVLRKAGYVAAGPCPRDAGWQLFRLPRA